MNPGRKTRRWWWQAAQLAALGAVFYAGRYYAFRAVANSPGKLAEVMAEYQTVGKKPAVSPVNATDVMAEFDSIMDMQDSSKKALHDYIEGLSAEALKGLLASFKKRIPEKDGEAIEEMLSRLTLLDPRAALEIAQSLPARYGGDPFGDGNGYVESVLRDWAGHDPAAALAAALQLAKDPNGNSYLTAVLKVMATQDPQAALAALGNLPDDFHPLDLYSDIFSAWAKTNPQAAAAAALALPAGSGRETAFVNILDSLSAKDPAAALAWANVLPIGADKNQAISTSLGDLAKNDPETAANLYLQLSGEFTVGTMFNIISEWAVKDGPAALAWAGKNLTGQDYVDVMQTAIGASNQLDASTATSILTQVTDPDQATQLAQSLANKMVSQNITAAVQWAQSLPADNATERNTALADVMGAWANQNPVAAAAYAQNLTNDSAFDEIASNITKQWGQWGGADPEAALAWAQNLPAGDGRDSAISGAVEQLGYFDSAAAWQAAQQLTGDKLSDAANTIFSNWSNAQPAQAAAALQSVPPGDALDNATEDVARAWLQNDPAAAIQWIDSLPPGTARDNAAEQVVNKVESSDPATAFTWAASISDPNDRADNLLDVADTWAKTDAAAAATAIQNALGNATNLTAKEQTALQKILNKTAGN